MKKGELEIKFMRTSSANKIDGMEERKKYKHYVYLVCSYVYYVSQAS